ncbi:hypothetical protein [uncultured Campylobacter sp.]|uniref:hypothetical protein n=1 Tax=uncultured Campylobacter sp. TaxID=218934 RepID=UPI003211C7E2
MLEEFEKELINTIKEAAEPKNAVIRAYLGEFNNKEEMELLIKGGESFVFVEFVDEKYENVVERSVTYNIHILACTSNKNQNYRQANKFKAYALCETIDERLRNSNLCNEFRIEPQSAKASLNDITDYGYVYVLTRQIRTQFLEKDEFLCS